ncbi:hypothetical protein HPP92_008744 [Vanilla planifolia]|uniref:Uncharacterized protein n=1 Tax=Vanilla planifolia TaxID=51239 RepID=A0A835RB14_VANPL|nr:hypothetical protein HPP92_008744 [Vanilla planifolia]
MINPAVQSNRRSNSVGTNVEAVRRWSKLECHEGQNERMDRLNPGRIQMMQKRTRRFRPRVAPRPPGMSARLKSGCRCEHAQWWALRGSELPCRKNGRGA